MSEASELEGLYSVIEESARLVGMDCSRDTVWPILTAYEDVIPGSVIAFRVETSARRSDDFSTRLTMIPKDADPYARALSKGLIEATDRPAGSLSSELAERCPIDNYGLDFGALGGVTKTFQFFPPTELQSISTLAGVPSMPGSLAENADFFTRHGVDASVGLTAVDYRHHTANVYFATPEGYLEPKNISRILSDIEMPAPSEELLKLAQEAAGFYVTLNWDSPKIQRICFSAMTPDPMRLIGHVGPTLEQLAAHGPASDSSNARRFIAYAASSPKGEYFKLISFYRAVPQVVGFWDSYDR